MIRSPPPELLLELEELELDELELDELLLELELDDELLELDDELLELELLLVPPEEPPAPPQPVNISAKDRATAPPILLVRGLCFAMKIPIRNCVCPGSDPAGVMVIVRVDGSNVAEENRLRRGEL